MSTIVTRNAYRKKDIGQAGPSGVKSISQKVTTHKPPSTQRSTQQLGQNSNAQHGSQTAKSRTATTEWSSDTIYLEPTDPEEYGYKHPAEIGKVLTNKGAARFSDIHKIGRFRFKVVFETWQDAAKLAKCKLDDVGLQMYVPTITKEIIAVVRRVPTKFSEEELRENLEADREIIKVERIKKKGADGLEDTTSIKVTFRGKEMSDHVSLYGYRFRTELYIFPMKQCANCWMFGHRKEVCKKTTKCAKCGKEHGKNAECMSEEKCLNCGGNHPSNDRTCPERKRQQSINMTMQKKRITMKEAQQIHPKNDIRHENPFDLLSRDEDEYPTPQESGEGTSQQHNRARGTDEVWRNPRRDQMRQRRKSETEDVRQETRKDSERIDKLVQKVEALEKNINVIRKVIRLQKGVQEEMKQRLDPISMEALVIKISTVLEEIVGDLGYAVKYQEEHSENENNQNNNNNGE